MKKIIGFIFLGILSLSVVFLSVAYTNKLNAIDYLEAEDFSHIYIDENTPSTRYYSNKMVNVDDVTADGWISWNEDTNVLTFYNVFLTKIADELSFDENEHRRALITIDNTSMGDVSICVFGSNEIVNYGTTFEFLGDNDYIFYNSRDSFESELHIQNRRTYDEVDLPTILFENEEGSLIFLGDPNPLTVSLTGVGGIKSTNNAAELTLVGKTNLFVNAEKEKDFHEEFEDENNVISFDDEEIEEEYVAIEGFAKINYSENDKYRLTTNVDFPTSYDEESRQTIYTNGDRTGKAHRFFYGNYRVVKTYDDLEYVLGIKQEDQNGEYINVLLEKDIEKAYKRDVLLDKEAYAGIRVSGYKRLFLNDHTISFSMDESVDNFDTLRMMYVAKGANLSIYGSTGNGSSLRSKISFTSEYDYGNFSLFMISNSIFRLMDYVNLESHENVAGLNNEYDGQILYIHEAATAIIYRGMIQGSDTFYEITSGEFALQMIASLTIIGGIGNVYLAELRKNTRGVILINGSNGASKSPLLFYSGMIRSCEDEIVHINTIEKDAKPWRYYGGYLKCDWFSSLFGPGYYDNQYATTYNDETQFPNLYQMVYIDRGTNDPRLPEYMQENDLQDNLVDRKSEHIEYNGYYQIKDCVNLLGAYSIRYAEPFYAPYIKKDLPDEINVSKDSAELTGYEITLFNPRDPETNEGDYTFWKGYSADLYVKLPDGTIMLYNKMLGNSQFGMEPLKSLGITFKDNQPVVIVKSSFPMEYDGTEIFAVITNNFTNAVTISNTATIHVLEAIAPAEITLDGPAEAFTPDGYTLEVGNNNHGVKINALVKSSYSDTVYVEWYDVTAGERASAKSKIVMNNVDENGFYYTSFDFSPSAGTDKLGKHIYRLQVYTYSKEGLNDYKLSFSRSFTFNVEASIPVILSQSATSLSLEDGGIANVEIVASDSVEHIGYKWYYYPSYDKMVGIDANSKNIEFNTLYPLLYTDKAILQSNGNKNELVLSLEDYLELGSKYRIRFKESTDKPGNNVKVVLEYGDDKHNVTPIDFSYEEISGNFIFSREFDYLVVDRADMYLNPTYAKLSIKFEDNVSSQAYHNYEEFFLEKYDEENNTWIQIVNLNPYHFGDNYLDVYELNVDGIQVKGNPLNYQVSLDEDGYYLYCKVYNMVDNTKYTYSKPIKINVGPTPQEPVFVDHNMYYEYIAEGDTITIDKVVETPFVNNQFVVDYEWNFIIYDENGEKSYVSQADLFDYGFTVSHTISPLTGVAQTKITYNNSSQAASLFNYHFVIELTAFSPTDNSLTDVVYTDVYWMYPDDSASIHKIYLYNQTTRAYDYDYFALINNSASKFRSGNDQYDIHDVIYLSDSDYIEFVAGRDSSREYYDEHYDDSKFVYEWYAKWMVEQSEDNYVLVDMPVEELFDHQDLIDVYNEKADKWISKAVSLSDYAVYRIENNKLYFGYCENSHEQGATNSMPLRYHNLVFYCKVYNPENPDWLDTEIYQVSYVDLYNLEQPKIMLNGDNPIHYDAESDSVLINIKMDTISYNSSIYPEYDIFYKPMIAKDNATYQVMATSRVSGYIDVLGLGYNENGVVYENGEFSVKQYSKNPELLFDYSSAPISLTASLKIARTKLLDYMNNENIMADYDLVERFYNYNRQKNSYSFEEYFPEYTKDELYDALNKLWYDYLQVEGAYYVALNKNMPTVAHWIGSLFLDISEDIVASIIPTGHVDEFTFIETGTNSIEIDFVKDSTEYIGRLNSIPDTNCVYSWYLLNEATDEFELIYSGDDAYQLVDTHRYTEAPLVYLLETEVYVGAIQYEDLSESYYNYYYINVVPEAKTPTINNIEDKEFEYLDSNFLLEVDATDNNASNSTLVYTFYIDNQKICNVTDSYIDNNIYTPSTVGEHTYKVEVTAWVKYTIGENEYYYASKTAVSSVKTFTVNNKVLSHVNVEGVDLPVVDEHPTTENLKATREGMFAGFKVLSAYWNIDDNQTFEYDTNYTLTIILELLKHTEWNSVVTASLNTSYPAVVTKLSDTQIKLTCELASTVSEEFSVIDINIPEYQYGSMQRPIDPIERDQFALSSQSWNIEEDNLNYNTEYILTLKFRIYNQFHFASDGHVFINDEEVEYEISGRELTVRLHYLFTMKATIKVNGEEKEVEADKDGRINLSLNGADATLFDGWYVGNKLISNSDEVSVLLEENGVVFEARFIELVEISNFLMSRSFGLDANFPIPEIENFETDEYVATFTWKTDDTNFEYGKVYVLEVEITLKKGYTFGTDKLTVTLNGYSLENEIKNDKLYAYNEYFFGYYCFTTRDTIKETKVADRDGKVQLEAEEELNGKVFVGWYLGDELISEERLVEITLTQNDLRYEAKYIELTIIGDIHLSSEDLPIAEVGKDSPYKYIRENGYFIDIYVDTESKLEYLTKYNYKIVISELDNSQFGENVRLFIDDKEVELTYDSVENQYIYIKEIIFLYSAKLEVLGKTYDIVSDENGNLSLDFNEEIPPLKRFAGWYVGDNLVSDKKADTCKVSVDALIIKAVFVNDVIEDNTSVTVEIGDGENLDIKDIIDDTDDKEVRVKIGDKEVIFDKDTVELLKELPVVTLLILTGKEYATGDVDKANLSNTKLVLEISLEGQVFNGKANIKVPVNFEVKEGEEVKVYYVDANGLAENMNATYENGIVSFETTHFSTYVIVLDPVDQNAPAKSNSWLIILIIVLAVLLTAGIVLFFILKNKKKDDNNNEPKEEIKEEPKSSEESNEEEKPQGVVFSSDKKSLNEEYAELDKDKRKLFDLIKTRALGKEEVRTTEAQDSYTIYHGKEKIVRLKIKKGEIYVEFFSNDKEFQDIMGKKAKEIGKSFKVSNEEDLKPVLDAIDYKYESITK